MSRIKKVVVLYDSARCGKTSILCELADVLMQNNPKAEKILRRKGSRKELRSIPLNNKGDHLDILFAIKIPQNDSSFKVVGIGSAGDDRDSVLRNFMFFDSVWPDYNFDIVFVAVREQPRKDGLGDCGKSFPLMQLEEIERLYNLQVERPFVRTGMKSGAVSPQGAKAAATTLESMI